MNKAQIIERMALIAHHQAAEVAEPSEQPFDLPAAFVTAQGDRPASGRVRPRRCGAIISTPYAAKLSSSRSPS